MILSSLDFLVYWQIAEIISRMARADNIIFSFFCSRTSRDFANPETRASKYEIPDFALYQYNELNEKKEARAVKKRASPYLIQERKQTHLVPDINSQH